MRKRRALPRFPDPKPLGRDEPPFACQASAEFYAEEKHNAVLNMRLHDKCARDVRVVNHAVGNLRIAKGLVLDGVKSAEAAEPVVRAMLESMAAREAARA